MQRAWSPGAPITVAQPVHRDGLLPRGGKKTLALPPNAIDRQPIRGAPLAVPQRAPLFGKGEQRWVR